MFARSANSIRMQRSAQHRLLLVDVEAATNFTIGIDHERPERESTQYTHLFASKTQLILIKFVSCFSLPALVVLPKDRRPREGLQFEKCRGQVDRMARRRREREERQGRVTDASGKKPIGGYVPAASLLFFGRLGWLRDAGRTVTAAASAFATPGAWKPRALPVAALPKVR